MEVDIIILSLAKTKQHIDFTVNAINSLLQSEKEIKFNVIIMENSDYTFPQIEMDNVKVINNLEPFNYNKFANIGIKQGNAKYIGVFNNDVIFRKNWCSILINKNYDSASPISTTVQQQSEDQLGWRTGKELLGWALFFKREEVYNKIGELDECVNFWFSDDCFGEQIKRQGIKHYLCATSKVDHLDNSNTLTTMSKETIDNFTRGQTKIFNEKYKRNKFGMNPEYQQNEVKFLSNLF